MTFGSLFSGIGGIDLGLERAGMTCAWQVEIDPWCRQVLAKHWPDVRRYEDVTKVHGLLAHPEHTGRHEGKNTRGTVKSKKQRELGRAKAHEHRELEGCGDGHRACNHCLEPVELIAGGFPCQDVSTAGQGAGIKEGTRSGLWSEFHRIICELRPRYVLVENVPGLFANGMGRVLGDLAEIGYDAEWEVLSAADVGAPHLRKRVFIVADAESSGLQGSNQTLANNEKTGRGRHSQSARGIARTQEDVADAERSRLLENETRADTGGVGGTGQEVHGEGRAQTVSADGGCSDVADAKEHRVRPRSCPEEQGGIGRGRSGDSGGEVADTQRERSQGRVYRRSDSGRENLEGYAGCSGTAYGQQRENWWTTEPDVGRVANGVPQRVDRLKGLGNAVVPQCAEQIGRRIMEQFG